MQNGNSSNGGDGNDAPSLSPKTVSRSGQRNENGAKNTIPIGTLVSIFENGGWVDGTVTQYEAGTYTVVWDNRGKDFVDYYDDFGKDLKELEKAVTDATVSSV